MTLREGRLLTASCTTGWLDWIHGELWLLPDGLLRVRMSLGATVRHGFGPTVRGDLPRRVFGDEEPADLGEAHGTNRWIPAAQIERADLHSGQLTSRLSLVLLDGARRKLLWLKGEPAERELRRALAAWEIDGS